MGRKEIENIILLYLREDLEIDKEISLDSSLSEDLEIDSMDLIDIMVFIRKTFGILVIREKMIGLKTVSDVVDFIESNRSE